MTTRIDLGKVWPAGKAALFALDALVADSGLDHTLYELIKIRASQLNKCAFCLDMHTKDARAAGETEQRIYALSAWRETPFFSDEERAVLALTEEITFVADGISDSVFDEAARFFDEETLGKVITAIISINAWNRLGVTQRRPVGRYQAPVPAAANN
ncbi:MAG: carboxymuconolactone decarboxylase family protein [Actinomycetota bacterium]|nr:carboxymuconolactone decarboxylase family protein [Actinomycetota bacterium]